MSETTWRFETTEQADAFIDFTIKLKRHYLAIKSSRDPCVVIMNNIASVNNDCLLQMAKAWHFGWMAGEEKKRVDWPGQSAEEINLVEAFILADRIHSWFAANDAVLNMNYLTLICLGYCGNDDEDNWAASFDCMGDKDSEWYEHVEDYLFAAKGGCPEEAIYRAAMKVKERIEND